MVVGPRCMPCLLAALAVAATATAQTTPPAVPPEDGFVFELPGSKKLKVGGQLRWRGEYRHNYDFNDDAGTNPFFIEQRARLNLDFTVNERVRAFLALQDVRTFGEETSTLDASADGFDLHEGFLDWSLMKEQEGRLRLGRQEISLGAQRLVSSLEWANQARSFDGARFDVHPASQIDAVAFATVLRQDRVQNDYQGSYFGGLYATGYTEKKDLLGDLYVLGLIDNETAANGTANRWTLGTRLVGKVGGFDADFEGALQFGEQDNADVPFGDVYALHFGVGYTLSEDDWKPRLAGEFNYATGNDPTTADNERFNTLFPFAHYYFGYMDFALWENISHFAIAAEVRPGKTIVRLAWHNFHSVETSDRFSGPAGTLDPGGAAGSSYMGDEVDLTCRHDLGDGIWGEAGAGIFLANDGVKDARGFDDNALFFYYMMGLRL